MSENVIRYDPTRQSFFFDGEGPYTGSELAMLIAQGSRFGIDQVCQGGVTVSAAYVSRMLTWTDEHGWFIDVLEDTDDHQFNPDQPTPGPRWGEAQRLLGEAESHLSKAASLRRLSQRLTSFGGRYSAVLYAVRADGIRKRGNALRSAGRRLLYTNPALDR